MTLKTKSGCRKLLALFIIVILLASLFGRLIQTDFGRIKVEQVTIDRRGAEINGELYYPAGTSSHDRLPVVVLAHGGGNTYGVFKGIALELARRGFVVLNESAYGSGISTMPPYEESGQGVTGLPDPDPSGEIDATENIKDFDVDTTPLGVLDSTDFVRSLEFVDETRVGLAGHSMGATRSNASVVMDCGYLTFNDIMIDVLYSEFGQEFAVEELSMSADALAEERLSGDELKLYESIRAEKRTEFDTRIKAAIVLGDTADIYVAPVTVNLAGHDVERITQTNMCVMGGDHDWCFDTSYNESAKAGFYSQDDLIMGAWYAVNPVTAESSNEGDLYVVSAASNAILSNAINEHATRMFYLSPMQTHAQDFFSIDTTSAIVKYFEQTLGYNRGELGSASAMPLDAKNSIWFIGSICNLIAMAAMIGLILSLGGLLLKTPFFEECVRNVDGEKKLVVSKRAYWIVGIITIALGFLAIRLTNNNGLFFIDPSNALPITRTASLTVYLLMCMSAIAIIVIAALAIISKKNGGASGFAAINLGMKLTAILKSLLLAVILLAAAYASLAVIDYFFGQDYRFWVVIFTHMKADMWFVAMRYFFIFPLFLITGAGINYAVRSDIPEWKDTLNTVVINSAGIWLCCLVETVLLYTTEFDLNFFSGMVGFTVTYHTLFIVPLTVYISRKFYNLTKSIWTGAAVNTLLICWSLTSSCGVNDFYYAQTWLSNFLNF